MSACIGRSGRELMQAESLEAAASRQGEVDKAAREPSGMDGSTDCSHGGIHFRMDQTDVRTSVPYWGTVISILQ